MADTLTQGKAWLFYVNAGAAPTTPDEITNYTKVGLLINEDSSTSNDTVDVRHKDLGGYRTQIPTTKGTTYSLTGYYPADGNAGTTILRNAAQATTLANQIVGFLTTTNVTGDYQERGTGYVLSFETSKPVDGVAEFTCEISVIGALTVETVDA